MDGGIFFILHGPKEAGFAAKLAPTFEPIVALPLAFKADVGGRSVSYGPAATCLVLLDQALAAHADVIARTAPPATTVICRNADVALPEVLSTYCVVDRKVFEVTAPALHEAVARKIKAAAAGRDATQRISHAPAMQRAIVHGPGKSSLLTRSAWGLAATAVVAGIAAPAIGGRAGAAGVADPDPIGGVSEASDVIRVTQRIQITAVAPQYYEPPPLAELLDHIDQNPRAAPDPSFTALAAEEPAAPEPLLTSLTAPVEPDVSDAPISVVAPVAHAGRPKGDSARGEAPEKPQAAPEPDKSSP